MIRRQALQLILAGLPFAATLKAPVLTVAPAAAGLSASTAFFEGVGGRSLNEASDGVKADPTPSTNDFF